MLSTTLALSETRYRPANVEKAEVTGEWLIECESSLVPSSFNLFIDSHE
jgi:hypothetical protein